MALAQSIPHSDRPQRLAPSFRDSPDADADPRDCPDVLELVLPERARRDYRRRLWLACPHCSYCGQRIRQLDNATLDHVLPQCQNGGDQPWNLRLSCQRCNNVKGGRSIEQWVRDIVHGAEPITAGQTTEGGDA